jgi:cytosine deaminase
MYDLIIKNARTRANKDNLVEIAIQGKKTARIGAKLGEAKKVIDAAGSLVSESFINGHLHLCKVYTLAMMDDEALGAYNTGGMGGAMTAIELAATVKEKYDEKWIIENVRKAVALAVKFGNTHIRAFADVDTKARLEGIKALLRAREEFKDRVTIEVVAFPQDGVVREPGAAALVEEALKLGADVVGGIPWIEYTEADEQEHIDQMFALAKKYNKDVSMLIDDAGDATLRTLEMLAVKTIKEGWEGRVTASCGKATTSMVTLSLNSSRARHGALPRAVLPQDRSAAQARQDRRGLRPADWPAVRARAVAVQGRGAHRSRAG